MESGRHLHVYSTSLIPAALPLDVPAPANRPRKSHAEKYTLRAIHPPSSLTSRCRKSRGIVLCVPSTAAARFAVSLSPRESRPSGIFIRRRVIRRVVSLSLESNDDTRRGEPENIILSSGHDLIVRITCVGFFNNEISI